MYVNRQARLQRERRPSALFFSPQRIVIIICNHYKIHTSDDTPKAVIPKRSTAAPTIKKKAAVEQCCFSSLSIKMSWERHRRVLLCATGVGCLLYSYLRIVSFIRLSVCRSFLEQLPPNAQIYFHLIVWIKFKFLSD